MLRFRKNVLIIVLSFCLLFTACALSTNDPTTVDSAPLTEATFETESEIANEPTTDSVSNCKWDVMNYLGLSDIISIYEMDDQKDGVHTWCIRYYSDDCEVNAYLSVPDQCLENQTSYSCVIYNRGGNQNLGYVTPNETSDFALGFNSIVFASDYRGTKGSTGKDEFGGADLHDVLKLIDFCEEFAFVDMDRLYMMGVSRGGMMTYMAIREDARIDKAIVFSGTADVFMTYNEREDMRKMVLEPFIGGTPEELPEEYENRSATYWADEFKCPVLIFHSKLDESVSYAQAEKLVNALSDAGKDYKFVSYDDDVHGAHWSEDLGIVLEWCEFGPAN